MFLSILLVTLVAFYQLVNNKNYTLLGIQGLQRGFEDKTSLFWLFCGIAIMGYNLYAEHILGLGLCDQTWSWKCIKDIITRFPNSLVIFQFMARAYLTTGEPEQARDYFLKVINSKTLKCNALLNLCNWDLIWSYARKCFVIHLR